MHGYTVGGRACASVSTTTPVVPLINGVSRSGVAAPIIGPPKMICDASSVSPSQNSSTSRSLVPMGTSRFDGRLTPGPVTVTTRSINGWPVSKTCATLAVVASGIGHPLFGGGLAFRGWCGLGCCRSQGGADKARGKQGDGQFKVADNEALSDPFEWGDYTFDGETLTMNTDSDAVYCADTSITSTVAFSDDGDQADLTFVEDSCVGSPRSADLVWIRQSS